LENRAQEKSIQGNARQLSCVSWESTKMHNIQSFDVYLKTTYLESIVLKDDSNLDLSKIPNYNCSDSIKFYSNEKLA